MCLGATGAPQEAQKNSQIKGCAVHMRQSHPEDATFKKYRHELLCNNSPGDRFLYFSG